MSETTYWIYSGEQPITNAGNIVLTNLEQTKRLAAEVSEGQPESTIYVKSHKAEPQGEWTGTAATFRGGNEIPRPWRVDFFGYLMDLDHLHLSHADVFYAAGGSELGPNGQLRSGYARNIVTVEADDADAAIDAVKAALGTKAADCSEWHARPA